MPSAMDRPYQVVLIDYDEALFAPMGFEADMLARVGARWETHQLRTPEAVLEVARDADVIAVQSVRPLLTREVLGQLPRCRCTIRAGAGYDSIDYKAATELGIMVCNTPTYCTDDVADHAVALMLSAVRHVPRLDAAMRRHRYARELARPTRRVAGTTLGIIGLGRIGSTTARRVRGWDMTVLAYDPYVTLDKAEPLGVTLVSLEELLRRSDFITVHCPLTDETHHLLSFEQFAMAKEGLILVNTARGPIVHEEALIGALEVGRVWAVGLDVTEQEPLPADSPLYRFDNVILTPHISANSPEAREDLYRLICEVSSDVVQGRIPPFVVNPEVLDHLRPASGV
jgi:D-3-phosphoglycerate dehydrogenase / 2-oxoglutarate reductase